ncbi:hypothetical protein PROH_09545 [Prochlorothrix hollandica PCC 9006 = CALU 1027]|uniref:Uncharacterized protein n=1 Tax=Prochlorothrix hollandica PCC 9006 = CALU 1027 TaxID=317619 RepID=A0A0M2PY54_PROHO|nr:hypothetical protein PROH_09545 [Prochlorothrix hollandica PCC 9006 = CALU 1027]
MADSPILVGAIPPWLPRWLAAKRVGTGARPLPETDGGAMEGLEADLLADRLNTRYERWNLGLLDSD